MADLYGAIKDSAVNRLISTIMANRPSLFNYAAPSWQPVDPTRWYTGSKEVFLSCYEIGLASGVDPDTTPRFTRIPYLPAPGLGGSVSGLQLPWCIQVSDVRLDFQPSDQITSLPAELKPPLAAQQFAVEVDATFGVGCASPDLIESMQNYFQQLAGNGPIIPVDKLQCFQLQLYVVGHLEKTLTGVPPVDTVGMELDGLEIVDLQPSGLESAVECYINALIRAVLIPQLKLALEPIVVKALGLSVTISPSLAPDVTVNPDVEENELRIWVNVKIT